MEEIKEHKESAGGRTPKPGGIKAHKAAAQRHEAEGRDREEMKRRRAARERRRKKRRIQRVILIVVMVLILLLVVLLVRTVVKKVTGSSKKEPAKTTAVEVKNKDKTDDKTEVEEASATINIAGDIIMHKPFLTSSAYYDGENYDYNPIFQYVKDYYNDADFAICTTEYALTGSNYSGYPTFCSPDAIADALADNGIDMCLLANNHIYDGGDAGLQRTMEVLDKDGILYTGARKTKDDKKYVVKDINGIKVGFFNYVFETEEVDGHKTINGISVSDESADLINTFKEEDPESLYTDVEQILSDMKDEGVEYTIACMHWGVEYQTEENTAQDEIAQKLCDLGVDALIASHPHVIEPVDLLTSSDGDHEMVCAYAIGNHLSNQRTEYMDGLTNGYSEDGMMVKLTVKRDSNGNISLEGADFIPTWVYMGQNPDKEYFILPLDKPDELEETTGLTNLTGDVNASLDRTNGIVGDGVKKVQAALPIAQKDPSVKSAGNSKDSSSSDDKKE